jgi:hypothetical protein
MFYYVAIGKMPYLASNFANFSLLALFGLSAERRNEAFYPTLSHHA